MKHEFNKKFFLLFAIFSFAAVFADGKEVLVWVTYDAEKNIKQFSNGHPAPAGATPGQFYEWEHGRPEKEKQWRSPLDIIQTYMPKNEGRAEFSHERHFAAVKEKNCKSCHEGDEGIGTLTYKSQAPNQAVEPHLEKSVGRFCSECHDGQKKIEARKEPVFTAFGRSGDENCMRCHAPKDHGTDYTQNHGEYVEDYGVRQCRECHRGAAGSSSSEELQAVNFRRAQLKLIENPEDESSFRATLPDNFCRYCHYGDNKAWREGGKKKHDD